jgi:hypothetical protein
MLKEVQWPCVLLSRWLLGQLPQPLTYYSTREANQRRLVERMTVYSIIVDDVSCHVMGDMIIKDKQVSFRPLPLNSSVDEINSITSMRCFMGWHALVRSSYLSLCVVMTKTICGTIALGSALILEAVYFRSTSCIVLMDTKCIVFSTMLSKQLHLRHTTIGYLAWIQRLGWVTCYWYGQTTVGHLM